MENPIETKIVSADATISLEMPPVTGEKPVSPPPPPAGNDGGDGNDGKQPVDDGGNVFIPGKHRVNPDGSPFRNAKGRFMPRGGRPRKNRDAAPGSPAGSPEPVRSFIPDTVPPSPEDCAGDGAAETGKTGKTADPEPEVFASLKRPKGAVSSRVLAEVITKGAYAATGRVTGKGAGAVPPPDMQDNIREIVEANLDDGTGHSFVFGIAAVGVVAAAYLLHVFSQPKSAAAASDKNATPAQPATGRFEKNTPVSPSAPVAVPSVPGDTFSVTL
ncbi:MAG: hypothetical protein LBK99_01610 [Opitutaceae bacterium]|jgi:hypothetical protein|nr:hypothetical protein [Opitutaceae bacterium]